MGLTVLTKRIIAPRPKPFVCASAPFETARCLQTLSTPEGKLGIGARYDLGDRSLKQPANERAAEKVYDFLLFGREVYLLESAADLVTPELLNRVLARLHRNA